MPLRAASSLAGGSTIFAPFTGKHRIIDNNRQMSTNVDRIDKVDEIDEIDENDEIDKVNEI